MTMPHSCCLSVAAAALLLGCGERPVNPVVPVVNNAAQTPTAPSEATVPAVPDSVQPDTAKSVSEDHKRIQGRWDFVTLTTGPRDSIVFSQDKITFHVRDKTVAGTFVLDSTAQPKRIDQTFAGNPDGPDRLGTAATTAQHRLIYDAATGMLSYDADGSGSGLAVQLLTLNAGQALTASQFDMV